MLRFQGREAVEDRLAPPGLHPGDGGHVRGAGNPPQPRRAFLDDGLERQSARQDVPEVAARTPAQDEVHVGQAQVGVHQEDPPPGGRQTQG